MTDQGLTHVWPLHDFVTMRRASSRGITLESGRPRIVDLNGE